MGQKGCQYPGSRPEVEKFVRACWPASFGALPENWETMAGDGSDRIFTRLRGDQGGTAVLVYGPNPAENRAYERIGRHLWQVGGYGPEFFGVDQEQGLFLIEDLGDLRLQAFTRTAGPEKVRAMYIETTLLLAEVHSRASQGFDPDWCFQTREYDRELILSRETGYFLEACVKGHLGLNPDSEALGREFGELADRALDRAGQGFMHRDCQSRNIMLKAGRPRLIDFQGGRLGPPGYDLASLLFDPYVRPEAGLRADCLDEYRRRRRESGDFDQEAFGETFPFLAACRLMQALGAYAFLAGVRGKTQFLEYLPIALGSLGELLSDEKFAFMPELRGLVKDIGLGREKLK